MRGVRPGLLLVASLVAAGCGGAGHPGPGPSIAGSHRRIGAGALTDTGRSSGARAPAAGGTPSTTTTAPALVVIPPAGQAPGSPGTRSARVPGSSPAPAGAKTLLVLFGSGEGDTAQFTVTEPAWQVNWSYDCSSLGVGNFIVTVNGYGPALDTPDAGTNQLGPSGTGSDQYSDQGTFNLTVDSECAWTLSVVES